MCSLFKDGKLEIGIEPTCRYSGTYCQYGIKQNFNGIDTNALIKRVNIKLDRIDIVKIDYKDKEKFLCPEHYPKIWDVYLDLEINLLDSRITI